MKPTQQEIIELARQFASRYTNRHYPDKPVFTFGLDRLEMFATLLLERFGAGDGEPVARLMKWIGKGVYQKKGYTAARTYEECPKDAYPNDWEENQELYTRPSHTDLRAEYERGLDDAARVCKQERIVKGGEVFAAKIEALKGKQ